MRNAGADPPSGTVAMLFTDIEGSTRLAQSLGDAWEPLLERHRELIRGAVSAENGYEVGTEGDSFFVAFAKPMEALTAALAAQRALDAEPWPPNANVRVRMGLHLGEVELRAGDYAGVEVHRAARLAAAGNGGQILLSDAMAAAARDRLPEGVSIRDLGEYRLKDFPVPMRIAEVVAEGLAQSQQPLRVQSTRRGNLPERRTSFVGREEELAAVRGALERARLVTLTGPGGVGKTSVALEAARASLDRYPDGAWLVELAPLRETTFVASTINRTLGLGEDPSRTAETLLADFLAERRALLLLDNLEQLLPEAAVPIDRLLSEAPAVTVLATSREALHVTGEQELPIPPLDAPSASDDALRLFEDRARAVNASFAVTDANEAAVREIIRRLDGSPLAIELAAARVKLLSPPDILERLSRGTGDLRHPDVGRPERQRTLRGAISWSYELLTPAEQDFFARLSVFAGGFMVESAAVVCLPDGGPDALDLIESLVDKSLLVRADGRAGTRFSMLETIREFAAEELATLDPDGSTAERHAMHVLDVVEQAAPQLTKKSPAWRDRVADELDNVRAALTWAVAMQRVDMGYRVVAAMWRFWHNRALLAEGRAWAERFMDLDPSPTASPEHGRALLALGSIYYWLRVADGANRCYRAALAEARQLSDKRLEADALVDVLFLISIFTELADHDEADATERRIRELGVELGDDLLFAWADFARAGREMADGHMDAALQRASRTLGIVEASGDLFGLASALNLVAAVAYLRGQYQESMVLGVRSAVHMLEIGDVISLQLTLRSLASTAALTGIPVQGAQLAGYAARLMADTGGVRWTPPFEPRDALEIAAEALGAEAANREYQVGHAFTLEQAMEVARSLAPAAARDAERGASWTTDWP